MKAIGDYLIGQTSIRPKVGIICGSGLGGLATEIENAEVFEYSKIPNFPVSTGKVAKSTCKRRNVILSIARPSCATVYGGQPYTCIATCIPEFCS